MIKLRVEAIIGIFVVLAAFLFIFLTVYLGIFRLDGTAYKAYAVAFKDVTGLNKKDEVKISGVKVGWVDDIRLDPQDLTVTVLMQLQKEFTLYQNATIIIRQDGLLGARFIDIMPGDASSKVIEPSGVQKETVLYGQQAASFEIIMNKINKILADAGHVAEEYNKMLGAEKNVASIQHILEQLNQVVTNLSHLSRVMGKVAQANENTIQTLLDDVGSLVRDLQHNKAAAKLGSAIDQIKQVADSVSSGDGILGTLMCDESSRNIKQTVTCVTDTVDYLRNVKIGLDSHAEFMLGDEAFSDDKDIKGYFNAFIAPCQEYFLLGGIITRSIGRVKEQDIVTKKCEDISCKEFKTEIKKEEIRKDTFLWNFQVGGTYGNVAFRGGIFDSTLGCALDFNLWTPFDWCTWISSFEVFAFRGRRFFDDERPHLKWLNRIFINDYFYLVAGADDFISKDNANAFIGGGLAFVF